MKLYVCMFAAILLSLNFAEAYAQNGRSNRSAHAPKAYVKSVPVRNVHYRNIGYRINKLPVGHQRIAYGNQVFFNFQGVFYQESSNGFLVVRPSIGIRINSLPLGFITLRAGTNIYYKANDIYYRQDGGEYVVIEEPNTELFEPAGEQQSAAPQIQFVIPVEGQSLEQVEQDQYFCHLDASKYSGFDPTLPDQSAESRYDYQKITQECLRERGYAFQ